MDLYKFGVVLCVIAILLSGATIYHELTKEPVAVVTHVELYVAEQEVEEEPFQYLNITLDEDIQDYVFMKAEKYDIDPYLIFAIIEIESGYQVDIISRTNDYGLMQVNRSNFRWLERDLGIKDLLCPYQNIQAGVHILKYYIDMGITELNDLLLCYNRNHGGATALWDRGIRETDYTREIIATMNRLSREHNELYE